MSDEMKLLMAMLDAMGFKVEIKQVSIAVQGEGDSVAVPFGREYVVTKMVDEVDASLDHMFGDVKAELTSLSVREEEPVDYRVMFKSFLKEHNAYDQFEAASGGWDVWRNRCYDEDYAGFISFSFTWCETPEGLEYWSELSDQWRKHLKTVKGE